VALTSISIRNLDYRRNSTTEKDLVDRVRAEFNEMRGFSPTLDQAARLFSLSKEECQRVFAQLQHEGFLGYCHDGRYRLT
jgi:hypothetical protein